MSIASEAGVVQRPVVKYATQIGWDYVEPEEAVRLRRGETGAVFHDVFVEQLQRLNPGVVDLGRAEEIIGRLLRVHPSIEGNLDAWQYLRGLKTVFVPDENRERDIKLLDTEEIDNNSYHVTQEFEFTNGTETIRLDVGFLVNGIPVLDIEAKSATRQEGLSEALDQFTRYHREGPELMALLQVMGLTHLHGFLYGPTWNLAAKALLDWREEAAGNFEDLIKAFLEPERIVRVLADYILFTRTDEELSKVVLRPHQMRATGRVLTRAADPEKSRGLVWHTQGSGKTYTMITAAKKLVEEERFDNPTVLMLVDRNELESQLFGNLESVGFSHAVQATSKKHLRELLTSGRRGVIVTTIQKFDDMPANIDTRENLFVLVDEAHRTTGGDLGNFLMGALPNATYIGFTGTPIDRTAHGKGTFKVFSVDDPERRYLDKYSIKESIEDGTTVPLHYALAPNQLQVDREVLRREFLSLAEAEGVTDVEELNRILQRAVVLKNELKSPERMAKVAAYVAQHFRENVEPMGFKAFLVAVDREACARYKRLLDEHLPPEYSAVVISPGFNDPAELAEFHLSEHEEKNTRKAFRKPDAVPKILIVTEKLLTGFDAPVLYCMYLDKPMRDHVLLQAIARVNRPYEEPDRRRKSSGFVLDFVGIFDDLESALAFDSSDIAGVIQDIDVLKTHFERLMDRGRTDYLSVDPGTGDDKAAEAVLEHFRDEEAREAFYRYFRELEEVYEVLSPDPLLRPFIEDYGRIAVIFRLLRASFDARTPLGKSLLRKTEELVQARTEAGDVLAPEHVYELGEGALEVIEDVNKPDTVKVFNLLKALTEDVRQRAAEEPYMLDIGERAEEIAQAFGSRQLATQEALEKLEQLIQDAADAEKEQRDSGLPPDAFAVKWLLTGRGIEGAEHVAEALRGAFGRNPQWRRSEEQERDVRATLYKALMETKTDHMAEVANWLLSVLKRKAP